MNDACLWTTPDGITISAWRRNGDAVEVKVDYDGWVTWSNGPYAREAEAWLRGCGIPQEPDAP